MLKIEFQFIFDFEWVLCVSLWCLLLCKVWKLRGNHSLHLSPVATELSRSRLQSGNYLFTRSSSAGDLPMLIPPLSLVYCLHRQVQTCLSTDHMLFHACGIMRRHNSLWMFFLFLFNIRSEVLIWTRRILYTILCGRIWHDHPLHSLHRLVYFANSSTVWQARIPTALFGIKGLWDYRLI